MKKLSVCSINNTEKPIRIISLEYNTFLVMTHDIPVGKLRNIKIANTVFFLSSSETEYFSKNVDEPMFNEIVW